MTSSAPKRVVELQPRRQRSMHSRPAWQEKPSDLAIASKGIVLTAIVIAVLVPLWMIVITSLSDQKTIGSAGGLVLMPHGLTLGAYREVLAGGVVTRAIGVSLFVTGVGTAISLAVTILAAYGLSKPSMVLHRPILFLLLMTLFFGAGIIPTYLLVSSLGLIDSLWALILPTSVSAFNVLVMRSFFMGIEPDILDSARIDGAGEWRVLASMVLPTSKAVIGVIGLFYGVGYWNAFFNAMLYINNDAKWPLQLVLRTLVLQGSTQQGNAINELAAGGALAPIALQMAVVVLALVPILIVYPFVQRHFKSGVMIGAVKG